jgi:N-acyl homoserine lactone hydrolase
MSVVHAIRTGLVEVRRPQMESRGAGVARIAHMLLDEEWSEWLPIYAWVIEHEEGVIVVDTGETSRVHEPGYHPRWHPFYRRATHFSVHPEEEIGPQLRGVGITARDVRHMVLTHLHTDHAGGLRHFVGGKTWVSRGGFKRASGFGAKVQGYLPHRWPKWLFGPFAQSMSLTSSGDVVVIPTPGHTRDHVSVVVCGSPSYFLAGDTSYNQKLLLAGKVDGVSPDKEVSRQTMQKIVALAKERPLVYLPSHDPEGTERLRDRKTLQAVAGNS